MKLCALVERQPGKHVKIFITDGGGEFNYGEMNEFCDGKGITHEFIAPYTPQHNGLAERRNRTLVKMTRCLLKRKNLPHSLG